MRDAGGTSVCRATVELARVGGHAEENLSAIPDVDSWRTSPEEVRILLRIDDNVSDVSADSAGGSLVEIASQVQDYIIDTEARPWPRIPGLGEHPLTPRLGDNGNPMWFNGDREFCAIGQLQGHQSIP